MAKLYLILGVITCALTITLASAPGLLGVFFAAVSCVGGAGVALLFLVHRVQVAAAKALEDLSKQVVKSDE